MSHFKGFYQYPKLSTINSLQINEIFHLEQLFNSKSINFTKPHENHTSIYIFLLEPLHSMQLQEKEAQKDQNIQEISLKRTCS